jgi:hypothetical protein
VALIWKTGYLNGQFTKANVENFVTSTASGWGSQLLNIKLNWGYQKPLDVEVVSLVPRQKDSIYYQVSQVILPSSTATPPKLVRKTSPPLGIPLADLDEMQVVYRKYLRDIVDGDLFEYVPVAYVDQEYDLPERLLTSICSYYSKASGGRHHKVFYSLSTEIVASNQIRKSCSVKQLRCILLRPSLSVPWYSIASH